jgi:hypothetical protein
MKLEITYEIDLSNASIQEIQTILKLVNEDKNSLKFNWSCAYKRWPAKVKTIQQIEDENEKTED